jgi:outer membrane usher protein
MAGMAGALQAAESLCEQPQTLVLAARVQGEPRGDWWVHCDPQDGLFLRAQDLPTLRLRTPPHPHAFRTVQGERLLPLAGLPGVRHQVHPARLELDIQVDPAALLPTVVAAPVGREPAPLTLGVASFINWSIGQSGPGAGRSQLGLELGHRDGPWLWLHQLGLDDAPGSPRRWVRQFTRATYDAPQSLRRWTLGDQFLPGPSLGRGLGGWVGGVSVGQPFGGPALGLSTPLGSVSGRAQGPSEVEVYAHGTLVRTTRVGTGEFEIQGLPLWPGATPVTVVVRDAFGRTERTTHTLYASPQLLPAGRHDDHWGWGWQRTDSQGGPGYGSGRLATSHRWGLRDTLTLGAAGQGQRGHAVVELSGQAQVQAAGVLSLAGARSGGAYRGGSAFAIQHSFDSRSIRASATWRQETAGFSLDPASSGGRRDAVMGASVRAGPGQWVSVTQAILWPHDGANANPGAPRRSTELGYSLSMPGSRLSLSVTLSRQSAPDGSRHGVILGAFLPLDGQRYVSTQVRTSEGRTVSEVQFQQSASGEEGWSYGLRGQQDSGLGRGPTWWVADADLRARTFVLRTRGEQPGSANDTGRWTLQASGGLARLEGRWWASRPLSDGFVLVRVGRLAGVQVIANGRPIGQTDANGELLVPWVPAFSDAQIAIDPQSLPIDHAVPTATRRLRLPERGSTVLDFQATRVRAVTARLLRSDADGPARPAGDLRVQGVGPAGVWGTLTAPDGTLYLDPAVIGHHTLQATDAAGSCEAAFTVPEGDQVLVDLGDLVCQRPAAQNRSPGPR